MNNLNYPIGKFSYNENKPVSEKQMEEWIHDIESLPGLLSDAVESFSDKQLDTPYREGGWTVRQVVHHLADSHANGYIRFKLALTEEKPTIKPYDQDKWAALGDNELPSEVSLPILEGIHQRWAYMLKTLNEEQWLAELQHPEDGTMDVKKLTAHYAWHGNHHLAHITTLKERRNW